MRKKLSRKQHTEEQENKTCERVRPRVEGEKVQHIYEGTFRRR